MTDASVNDDSELPIEHSHLERRVEDDGVTVKVFIYRVPSIDLRWQLEVVDQEGGSTCWDVVFTTEQEALDAFEECVRTEGMRCFLEPRTIN